MTVTSYDARAVLPDAVAIDRLTELLVVRDRDDAWWRSVASRVDHLAAAVGAHERTRCPGLRAGVPASVVARMQAEHRVIDDEFVELRLLLQRARSEKHGHSLVLAACTEVIALVRAHERRAREALVETL